MSIKALFLAPHFSQARHWANLWGYQRNDWRYVGTYRDILEYRNSIPVFLCGSHAPNEYEDIHNRLVLLDFDVYDAQSIEIPDNQEFATGWV